MVSYSIILRVHTSRELQSWIKSNKIAYPLDLVPLWPLPSPHPSQYCLVKVRNEPAKLQHCLFGGTRGVFCRSHCFQGLYFETRRGNVYFFLTFLSKIVGSMKQLQSFLPGLGLISTQLTSQNIHDSTRQFCAFMQINSKKCLVGH